MPATQLLSPLGAMNAPAVVWAIFILCLVIILPTTLAFYYHWGRFAPSHFGAIATIAVYTVGLSIILLGMLGIVLSL